MRFLAAGEVCKVLNIRHRTLQDWIHSGIIRPMRDGIGTGHHRLFRAVPDTLAIAVGRSLRGSGIGLAVAGEAVQYVMGMSEESLTRDLV